MKYNAEDCFSLGVWGAVIGIALRMLSQPLSFRFFGAPSPITANTVWWSGQAALAQIALMVMLFGGALMVAAFFAPRD